MSLFLDAGVDASETKCFTMWSQACIGAIDRVFAVYERHSHWGMSLACISIANKLRPQVYVTCMAAEGGNTHGSEQVGNCLGLISPLLASAAHNHVLLTESILCACTSYAPCEAAQPQAHKLMPDKMSGRMPDKHEAERPRLSQNACRIECQITCENIYQQKM